MSSASRSKTATALANLIDRVKGHPSAEPQPPTPGPRPPAPSLDVLEERIRGLQARVDELTARINATMLLLAGAVATQILIALLKP